MSSLSVFVKNEKSNLGQGSEVNTAGSVLILDQFVVENRSPNIWDDQHEDIFPPPRRPTSSLVDKLRPPSETFLDSLKQSRPDVPELV